MDNDFDSAVQKQLDAAMPWVGLYIAAASAVCTLATAADAVNGLRQKKLWFPCKYSSLNSASLTMLAVALKLPMDLNTVMIKSQTDAAAKFASIYFVYTTLINFMPSLGSMNDKEFLANVVGLAILVITVMQLDAAMPWLGLYITAASAVCILAITADAVNSFRQKKLWFPCKYSSLNAASLTLLAVAMKLPMDLNTVMIKSQTDAAAKFASLSFMSTIVTNFMPSLGSMNDKELLANVVGLVILVITITGNVGIQFIELRRFLKPGTISLSIMSPSVLMLFSLVRLVSLAVTVSTMKRNLKRMYEAKHYAMLQEEEGVDMGDDERRHIMMKYWVMAESCSPQFVMARSVVCTASSMIICFGQIILTLVNHLKGYKVNGPSESPYGIYTKWILLIQATGMQIGVIVSMVRWFIAVKLRCSTSYSNSFSEELKVEDYWIQTLKDWRSNFAGLEIQPNRCMKFLHDVKWCVLTLCIGIQTFILLLSKMLVFLSVFFARPFLSCLSQLRMFVRQTEHTSGGDTDTDTYLNLSRYVLLLEGEAELPPWFVRSLCGEADRMIQTGRKKQPKSLVNLLHKSVNFNGVGEFNSSQIPSLFSRDPPDCWTLPVVTLTSIAIALPNTALHKRKQLLSSVSEGISLANIVEETLDTSAQLKNMREAARVAWVEVMLYSKWLDIDLDRAFQNCKSSEEVLQELSCKAEGIVMEFKKEELDPVMENVPVKVVAANSMYRICQTILVSSVVEQTCEEMVERLSVMIADILAACLTNLPYAMIKMCHQNSIEKRERSVREAFLLLGKTEQVVELVRQSRVAGIFSTR